MAKRYNYLGALVSRDRKAAGFLENAKRLEDPELKIKLYKQAMELDPTRADVMYSLACLYLELKPQDKDQLEVNRDKAIKYYERASELGHAKAEDDLLRLQGERLKKLAEKSGDDLRRLEKERLKKLAEKYKQDGDCCEKRPDSGIINLKLIHFLYSFFERWQRPRRLAPWHRWSLIATPKSVMPQFIAYLTNRQTKKAKRKAEPR